ncbi:hypothetical protein CB0940_05256 [Cercospora beticola]|uniref:Rhodopsin domain-containing protein n=1 Tax=Cercospora beticola TaxID=122368 RepID=A0A2G5HN00_CERBT|nr:hypothetical protein CB0940_05256 [Cercospora beticola]PIA93931.1 hypothetical protein CB0940_05256 [Cercospora beticola]WPB02576.1 hypothetical protein RHO25_007212 [Cercospora beticola]CAK1362530.1 unnamed protein product [Cercospora beticola]
MPTLESRATLGVNITFFVLSWIAVSLRVFVRAGMLRNFGSDDWTMLATLVFFTAYLIVQLGGVVYGTGQHLSDIEPHDAETALMYWYLCEIFYVCSTTVLKISIGLFLLRVATNRIHIWIIRIVMLLGLVFGVAFTFVIIFQCWPISDWWSLDPSQKHCIKPEVVVGLTYGVSGLNVIADWTLGILPAFIVKDLQMSKRQKRLVAVILSFAAIGSSATIVRLPYVGSLIESFDGWNGDFLFNTVGVAIWTTVEIGVGITAGCMATLRPLFRMALEKMGVASSSGGKRSGATPGPSRGRATPLDDFVMVSPKHGRTITTITGNDRERHESERSSGSSSRERLSRPLPDKITKNFVVEYDEDEADHEHQHGFTPLPRRN